MDYETLMNDSKHCIHICSTCPKCYKCHKCSNKHHGTNKCSKYVRESRESCREYNDFKNLKYITNDVIMDNNNKKFNHKKNHNYAYIYKTGSEQILNINDDIDFNNNGLISCDILHSIFTNISTIIITDIGKYCVNYILYVEPIIGDVTGPLLDITVGLTLNNDVIKDSVYSITTSGQITGQTIIEVVQENSRITLRNLGVVSFIIPEKDIVTSSISITKL